MNYIENKVVIITGASSGIGRAIALGLGEKGAKLVLAARGKDKLDKITEEVKAAGAEAVSIPTDVSNKDDVKALADFAVKTYGRIDVLINNAGVMPASFLVKNQTQEWDQLIDINIKGVLYNIGAVLPIMRGQGSGQIINISSNAAYTEISPYSTVYCMTKHAVKNISSGLRQEEALAGSHIKVTDVGPGMVDTNLTSTIVEPEMKAVADQIFGDKSKMITPDNLAKAVAYAIDQPENVAVANVVVQPNN